MIKNASKQSWETGSTVNVGFLRGLQVLARIATPGNGFPDEYALQSADGTKFYRFTPHNGIARVDSKADALSPISTH